jgi:hypothetical protein
MEVGMKKYVGLWIDHAKTVFVTIETGNGNLTENETITKLESDVEPHLRLAGGSRSATPYGPEDVVSDKTPEERRKHELHRYYQKVLRALWDADRVYIMGPGEAPRELAEEIRSNQQLAPRLLDVRKTDKMTDRQIAAEVRKRFGVTI